MEMYNCTWPSEGSLEEFFSYKDWALFLKKKKIYGKYIFEFGRYVILSYDSNRRNYWENYACFKDLLNKAAKYQCFTKQRIKQVNFYTLKYHFTCMAFLGFPFWHQLLQTYIALKKSKKEVKKKEVKDTQKWYDVFYRDKTKQFKYNFYKR